MVTVFQNRPFPPIVHGWIRCLSLFANLWPDHFLLWAPSNPICGSPSWLVLSCLITYSSDSWSFFTSPRDTSSTSPETYPWECPQITYASTETYQIVVELLGLRKGRPKCGTLSSLNSRNWEGVSSCLGVKVSLSPSPTHHFPHPNPKYKEGLSLKFSYHLKCLHLPKRRTVGFDLPPGRFLREHWKPIITPGTQRNFVPGLSVYSPGLLGPLKGHPCFSFPYEEGM